MSYLIAGLGVFSRDWVCDRYGMLGLVVEGGLREVVEAWIVVGVEKVVGGSGTRMQS